MQTVACVEYTEYTEYTADTEDTEYTLRRSLVASHEPAYNWQLYTVYSEQGAIVSASYRKLSPPDAPLQYIRELH